MGLMNRRQCKNVNFEHHSRDLKNLPGQKQGASIREGASIRIN